MAAAFFLLGYIYIWNGQAGLFTRRSIQEGTKHELYRPTMQRPYAEEVMLLYVHTQAALAQSLL